MIKKLLGLVFNRWVLTAVLLLAIGLAIWIVGPLIGIAEARPLESENARWIAIGIVALLVVATVAWKSWRARRGNAAVVQQLIAAAPADRKDAESPDLQAVRQRFEQAMQTLRRARFGPDGIVAGWRARLGGRYLYELPWYLIIGAPGSGKTTALHNCGLKFPLAGNVGDHAVRGVGGTRHCDWWFTDRAVLIDTAGRFTTQDSDRADDRATWGGFLGMLKKARPRQPVNGVLITVSVTDLLAKGPGERRQHADTVRKRLQELHEGLSIRFPIYLLVTKTDLLAGFMEYFATLDKEQRATPWGTTFPVKDGTPQNLQRFTKEFDALLQRLHDGLIERLQPERDAQRRARIYGFSGQFAALRGVLQEFLATVFSPSPYEAEPLLRGVYFVSGTQEGTPIDRVLGAVARTYKLERAVIAPNQASGRSYFLTRLLGEVVFAESGLAGTNLKWERRRTVMAIGAYAAIGVVTAGALTAWTVSYVNNRRYVDDVAKRVDDVRAQVQGTPNRASPDLLPIIPALASTRGLAADGAPVPAKLGFGLFQGPKLDSAAHAAYGRMLTDAVLPRVALRVEDQLRQAGAAPESQYEALKAYLMLHDIDHFDAKALKTYVERDWEAQFGRSVDAQTREQWSEHLDALLAQGPAVSPLPEDKALIAFHRQRLAALTLPQRIYDRMRHDGFGKDFPEFTIVRAAGNSAANVFVRASGQPLTRGVPGLFSYDGYHKGFQKEVGRVAKQLAAEQAWVLGIAETRDAAALVTASDQLLDDVRRIYLNEYATVWEGFVNDVRLVPMTSSLSQSIQTARLLSGSDNPLAPLLKAMSHETTLLSDEGRNVIEKAQDKAAGVFDKGRKALSDAITQKKTDTGQRIESIVDDRFAGLRRLVTAPPGGKPPLDDTIALIAEVHVLLSAQETVLKGGGAPQPSPLPNKMKAVAATMPEPVHSMMDSLSESSGNVSQRVLRVSLAQEVRSQVGEFCMQSAAGRYPLDKGSARDITSSDFAQLFGPGGKIDQLMQSKLAPYIDTTARPWRFRPVEGVPLGSDTGSLPQLQRAQAIRETFFPAGPAASLRLTFKPVEMDAALKQFILDIDGQIVRYDHGPQIPMAVQWPGPRGALQVRVQVSPPASATTGLVQDGPWALLRLFDRVKIEPTNVPERFRAVFDVDGRKAVFEITASSVRNPFRMRELNEFSCPMGL